MGKGQGATGGPQLHLESGFFRWIAALDFELLGYAIVAVFVLAWGVPAAVYKLGQLEERFGSSRP